MYSFFSPFFFFSSCRTSWYFKVTSMWLTSPSTTHWLIKKWGLSCNIGRAPFEISLPAICSLKQFLRDSDSTELPCLVTGLCWRDHQLPPFFMTLNVRTWGEWQQHISLWFDPTVFVVQHLFIGSPCPPVLSRVSRRSCPILNCCSPQML